MSKIWNVARYDIRRHVFTKGFIFVLLSVPFFIAIAAGSGYLAQSYEQNYAPVGYVDHAGILTNPIPAPVEKPVELIPYENEDQARQALDAEEIQAYYVLSADYWETRSVELVYLEDPGNNAKSQFYDFMQINLLADQPSEIAHRAAEGDNLILRSVDGRREFPEGGPPLGSVIPLIVGVAFIGLLLFSAGYMLEGVVEEKENRTMEVMLTSISPSRMISGKVLGVVGISFTQLITWILFGILVIFIGANVAEMSWFQNLKLDWGGILMVAAIGIPSYFMASALMFAIGSTVTESQEAQSVGVFFYFVFMSPLFFIVAIIEDPNGPITTAMTLLPFTSLMTIGFRNMLSTVPLWQFALSLVIQIACAIGAIWLAARAFRLGMLLYGQRISLKDVLRKSEPATLQEGETS
jgi:ABC-2 type transport system permease protein